jgi:hypothetical protein
VAGIVEAPGLCIGAGTATGALVGIVVGLTNRMTLSNGDVTIFANTAYAAFAAAATWATAFTRDCGVGDGGTSS